MAWTAIDACSHDITFRPLQHSDFARLQKWLAAPHVAVWWNERFEMPAVEAKYGAGIDGRKPMHFYVIEHRGTAIGFIQWYRWRDFPEHAERLGADTSSAGVDLAIGEIEMTGRGLGPVIIRDFATTYIFVSNDIRSIVADPATTNARSVTAFRKAGFSVVGTVRHPREAFERHVVRLQRESMPRTR